MPDKIYDIICIGAGSGGLNIASFMNKAGFSVLLVDKSDANIGGDCLNFGCVPSKALIHLSRIAHQVKHSNELGLKTTGKVDIKKVMKYVDEKREVIRKHENAAYFTKRGMDVALGIAKFTGKNDIEVSGKKYKGKKIVLASGSRPKKLKVQGIDKVKTYYDNENIFNMKVLPKKLLVIGGGPIGLELGQAMSRLGSEVTIVQRGPKFLDKEHPEIASVLKDHLVKEGIKFKFNCKPLEFPSSNEVILQHKNGKKNKIKFDGLLVGIGRELNIPEGLDKAGIELNDKGKIKVNDYMQTTNKNILLCGDIAGGMQFTHAAEVHAGVILTNFFSPFKKKLNMDKFAWTTFTHPEIATFGLQENQLQKHNITYKKLSTDFQEDDRAIVDNATFGKLILYISNKDKILGGTMVARNAGELTQELLLANSANISIKEIFNKTYPYPTAGRINKRLIAKHYSNKLTDFSKKILRFLYKI